jgi:hypothetical protein
VPVDVAVAKYMPFLLRKEVTFPRVADLNSALKPMCNVTVYLSICSPQAHFSFLESGGVSFKMTSRYKLRKVISLFNLLQLYLQMEDFRTEA